MLVLLVRAENAEEPPEGVAQCAAEVEVAVSTCPVEGATPDMVIPLISFALMTPEPVVAREAPVPTSIAAVTLVEPVMAENAGAVLATLRTPAVQVVPEPHSRTPKPPEEP